MEELRKRAAALAREHPAAAAGITAAAVAAAAAGLYYALRSRDATPPSAEAVHGGARGGAGAGAARKKRREWTGSLTPWEKQVAGDFADADELVDCGFEFVGGNEAAKQTIRELIVWPLANPELYAHSKLASRPTGLLLYGPPGTGKTLLAKAIAKESCASFLAVNIATLMSKWHGETPKLIDAVFSLARKRGPTVMFIDEIDGARRSRSNSSSGCARAARPGGRGLCPQLVALAAACLQYARASWARPFVCPAALPCTG
jgi:hypothetical protein